VFQRPTGRPNVSVTFLGFTNDATDRLLAHFAVSNLSASAVYRQPYYFVHLTSPTEPESSTSYQPPGPLPGTSVLRAGASEILSIPPPTNQSPWRISLRVYPDGTPVRFIKQRVSEVVRVVGLKPQYRDVYFVFRCDWIESEKP
jgi:hypothetical protein